MGRSTALVLSVAAAVAGAALQDLLAQSYFFESGTVFATDSWEYTQVCVRATGVSLCVKPLSTSISTPEALLWLLGGRKHLFSQLVLGRRLRVSHLCK